MIKLFIKKEKKKEVSVDGLINRVNNLIKKEEKILAIIQDIKKLNSKNDEEDEYFLSKG